MINSEFLAALSDMLDVKLRTALQPVKDGLSELNGRMQVLEQKVDSLDQRIDSLERRVESLEQKVESLDQRVDSLEQKVESLDQRVDTLEQKVDSLDQHVERLDQRIIRTELMLENETNHNIRILAENYVPAAKRYEKASLQIDAMQADIDILKSVVAHHSEMLQCLT